MNTYRFHIRISDQGTIKLPAYSSLSGKEAEIIVLLKGENMKEKKKFTAADFVSKWAGVLKNKNIDDSKIDDSKFDYLSVKYK